MAKFSAFEGSSSRMHGRSSSTTTRRFEVIVKERCRSNKNPLGMKEAVDLFHQMLDEMPKPSVSSFNLLLASIARIKSTHHHHRHPPIISLYNKMNRTGGISPDIFTFGIIIGCCRRMNRVVLGFAILGSLLKRGWRGNAVISNSLINGLCKQKKVGEAAQLLDKMRGLGFMPNVVTCTTLIKGVCSDVDSSLAVELLQKMSLEGGECEPDVVTYGVVINALCKEGAIDKASELFEEMISAGIAPNVVAYSTLIDSLCKDGAMDGAATLYKEMVVAGIAPDVVTYSTFIEAYCKVGAMDKASKMFEEMSAAGVAPVHFAYTWPFQPWQLDGSHQTLQGDG